jgi:hypothetical protein
MSAFFDVTDSCNRYSPCPRCGAMCSMGLSTQRGLLAVMCCECGFRGPGVPNDSPGAENDRLAFEAWNETSRELPR